MIWFTSDTHFGHANVIKYCKRPFASIEDHDAALIANWQARVKQNDMVYHLGDFGFSRKERLAEILSQLPGQIYFVRGNHDNNTRGPMLKRFIVDVPYKSISVMVEEKKQKIILCHYPFESWDRRHVGSWHLHGHSHGNTVSGETLCRLDVGVDCHGFSPVSLDDVAVMMAKKHPVYNRHGVDFLDADSKDEG